MYSKENKFRSTSDELAKHFPYDHVLAGAVRRRVGAKQTGEAARARARTGRRLRRLAMHAGHMPGACQLAPPGGERVNAL